ncbi:hypothetical protein D1007_02097 [Hordeum vulgare]|nr:hypothetical protein D1007_02097 [Hordeum vulgare]
MWREMLSGFSVELIQIMVRNQSGEWIYAKPVPGTFVCNIGDMLKVWSNGIYQPTLHRVVNNSPRYRVSVAFFYESNFDAAVEPVEFCWEKTGGVAKYEKVGSTWCRKSSPTSSCKIHQ